MNLSDPKITYFCTCPPYSWKLFLWARHPPHEEDSCGIYHTTDYTNLHCPTWQRLHENHSRHQSPAQHPTTWSTLSASNSWPCQKSPLCCHPVRRRVQSIFPQNRLKSHPQHANHLQGWRDPKNCLLHVMIINDGWTTKLIVHNVTRPIVSFSTTPIRRLANSMPIVPSKSNTTLAKSLYECSNMGQLTNYCYTCLNYPVNSTLTKAIDRGYLKGWQGLTSQWTSRHISHGIWNGSHGSTTPRSSIHSTHSNNRATSGSQYLWQPLEDVPQEPHSACTHFVFMAIYKINGYLFTNQTGHFPITSNRGHAYVVIFYIFDASTIWSVPIKN